MNSVFKRQIRGIRSQRNVSLESLSKASGVSVRTLRYWESGAHSPRMCELGRVLDVLQASEAERQGIYAHLGTPRSQQALTHEDALPADRAPDTGEVAIDGLLGGGTLLSALRYRRGLTTSQVAEALGVRPITVHRWESDRTNPSEENLVRLLALLAADDVERQAILRRRLALPGWEPPLTLAQCEAALASFRESVHRRDATLTDLAAVALDRQLALHQRQGADVLRWRVALREKWALWLHRHDRNEEALLYARGALSWVRIHGATGAAVAGLAITLGAASERMSPRSRARLFQFWLDFTPAAASSPLLCDLAISQSLCGAGEEALRTLSMAQDRLDSGSGYHDHCYRTSWARILANTGRAQAGLVLMPDIRTGGAEEPFDLLIWGELLARAGENDSARRYRDRLARLIEETAFGYHPYLEALTQQIEG